MYYLWLQSDKTRVTESKWYIYGLFNDVTSSGNTDNLPPTPLRVTQALT